MIALRLLYFVLLSEYLTASSASAATVAIVHEEGSVGREFPQQHRGNDYWNKVRTDFPFFKPFDDTLFNRCQSKFDGLCHKRLNVDKAALRVAFKPTKNACHKALCTCAGRNASCGVASNCGEVEVCIPNHDKCILQWAYVAGQLPKVCEHFMKCTRKRPVVKAEHDACLDATDAAHPTCDAEKACDYVEHPLGPPATFPPTPSPPTAAPTASPAARRSTQPSSTASGSGQEARKEPPAPESTTVSHRLLVAGAAIVSTVAVLSLVLLLYSKARGGTRHVVGRRVPRGGTGERDRLINAGDDNDDDATGVSSEGGTVVHRGPRHSRYVVHRADPVRWYGPHRAVPPVPTTSGGFRHATCSIGGCSTVFRPGGAAPTNQDVRSSSPDVQSTPGGGDGSHHAQRLLLLPCRCEWCGCSKRTGIASNPNPRSNDPLDRHVAAFKGDEIIRAYPGTTLARTEHGEVTYPCQTCGTPIERIMDLGALYVEESGAVATMTTTTTTKESDGKLPGKPSESPALCCCVCLEESVSVVCLPCSHLSLCPSCANHLSQAVARRGPSDREVEVSARCPVCRTTVAAMAVLENEHIAFAAGMLVASESFVGIGRKQSSIVSPRDCPNNA